MVAATVGIIIYRVVSRVDIFDSRGSIGPTLASVTSSFLNTVCIMVMGKVCLMGKNNINEREITLTED